jgi:hypothetical protein
MLRYFFTRQKETGFRGFRHRQKLFFKMAKNCHLKP